MRPDSTSTLFKLAFCAGMAFLLAACEATNPQTTGTGNDHPTLLNACFLLAENEVSVIMGKPVLSVKQDTSQGYITHCVYTGSIDSGYFLPTHLDITVVTTAGLQSHLGASQNVPAYFASLRTSYTPANQETVPGIGQDAFWYSKSGRMYFYKGDVSVDILFRPHGTPVVDTSAAARSGSISAAQRAVSQL